MTAHCLSCRFLIFFRPRWLVWFRPRWTNSETRSTVTYHKIRVSPLIHATFPIGISSTVKINCSGGNMWISLALFNCVRIPFKRFIQLIDQQLFWSIQANLGIYLENMNTTERYILLAPSVCEYVVASTPYIHTCEFMKK